MQQYKSKGYRPRDLITNAYARPEIEKVQLMTPLGVAADRYVACGCLQNPIYSSTALKKMLKSIATLYSHLTPFIPTPLPYHFRKSTSLTARALRGFPPLRLGAIIAGLLIPDVLTAEENDAGRPELFEPIWRLTELYRGASGAALESIAFTGRYQLDYANFDADEGHYEAWVVRRFRLGVKANMFESLTFHLEGDFDIQEADPFYKRLTDVSITWSPRDAFEFKVGKQSAMFTLDGATSSKQVLTIDRNNLSNLWFSEEYLPGATISGSSGKWRYSAGIFSSGSKSPEFGDFDGSGFLITAVGREFSDGHEDRQALLSLHYVYQDPDENNTFTAPHEHVVSLNFRYQAAKWGFRSDLAASDGYGAQSNLIGAVAMPFYNLSEKLQLVAQYTYLDSSDHNGLRLALYENRVESGRGDRYNEFYAGLNAYLYGHKFKFQTGIKSATMDDRAADGGRYRGWGWTSALRVSW
jgi:phosphate-selective porin OprO/OprP